MRAINANIMKQLNRRMVLDCIRRRPLSRAELSDETQLTRASITQIVESLMAEGYVAESNLVDSRGPGRRQTKLMLQGDSLHFAGIYLTHDSYHLSIVNLEGKPLWNCEGWQAGREPKDILREMAARLEEAALEHADDVRHIFGAGLCAPGMIDPVDGTLLHSWQLPAWKDVPIARILEELLGWKVHSDSVANASVLDEKYFGFNHAETQNFMLLRADEDVSAGLVLGNRLFVDSKGRGPQIGHVSMNRNGPLCSCGNRGCLQQYLSFPAALKGTPFASWAEVVDCIPQNAAAAELFDRIAEALCFVVANVLNIFCLDKVVLSGDLVYGGAQLAQAVNERVAKQVLCCHINAPVVAANAVYPSRIAAMPAYHKFFSE